MYLVRGAVASGGSLLQGSKEIETTNLSLGQVSDIAQSVQGFVTAIGIIAAGFWALYVFGLGRSYAPNIQIRFALKQMLELTEGRAVIVTVKLTNIGRTHVAKRRFAVGYKVASSDQIDYPELAQLETLDIVGNVDPLSLHRVGVKWKRAFSGQVSFEPNEEVTEEIVIPLGQARVFKVAGLFIPKPSTRKAIMIKLWRRKKVEQASFTQTGIFDTSDYENRSASSEENTRP